MSTVRVIAKNTLFLFSSNVVGLLLKFVFIIYAARSLGTEGFGILAFAIAFCKIFSVIADLGLSSLTTREVARDRTLTEKYLGNIVVIKMLLSLLTFGLIILTVNILGYPKQTIYVVWLMGLTTISESLIQMFNSIFQAYEKMEYQSIGQILNGVLLFGGALVAIAYGFNVVGFAFIYFAASTLVTIYALLICSWRFVRPRLKINIDFWRKVIPKAIPFGLTGIFITVYYNVDTVMLSFFKGNEIVGAYNAAYRMFSMLLFIPMAYTTTIFPVMSRKYVAGESMDFIWIRSLKYMIIVSIPVALGTTLLSERFVMLFFGPGYEKSVLALQILIWSFVLACIGGVLGYLLNAVDRQMTLTKITCVGVCVNIGLNILVIPRYSLYGASVATNLSRLAVIILEFVILARIGYKLQRPFIVTVIRVLISALVMATFVLAFNEINLIVLVILAALLYITALFLTQAIDSEDRSLLQRMMN